MPLVVTVASHQSTTMYKKILNGLPKLDNIKYVLADFEMAEAKAFIDLYPGVKVSLFYFFKFSKF